MSGEDEPRGKSNEHLMEKTKREASLVSVHGGHSAEFCSHAEDTLEAVIEAYIKKGFSWIGITEHMPSTCDDMVPDEESEEGIDAQKMYDRFSAYIKECRELQKLYASEITIYVGFETETYRGYEAFVRSLIEDFSPDYIVGSVHHVDDVPIDVNKKLYEKATSKHGGLDGLYCAYFDEQYKMIHSLEPAVVGHFDLIRIWDPEYSNRIKRPDIWERIERNLSAIAERKLILDFNLRAIVKGQPEPYVARDILTKAYELGVAVVPGDDSHGVRSVGRYCSEGVRILEELGFDTNWPKPKVFS